MSATRKVVVAVVAATVAAVIGVAVAAAVDDDVPRQVDDGTIVRTETSVPAGYIEVPAEGHQP